jgi:hydrogenase maturation protein HypF
MDYRPMSRDIIAGLASGRPGAQLARAFHETLAAMLARCAAEVASGANVEKVVLSGGCFVNRILADRLEELITQTGLKVYTHQKVPCSDVGIALGQAIIASEKNLTRTTKS